MGYLIIDSHMHLWNELNGCVENVKIRSLGGGKSTFIGGERQMMPPYMIEGKNTAGMFIANMNYAGVLGAVITQEYIDGNQNDYLLQVKQKYKALFKICGLLDHRLGNETRQVQEMISQGFDGIKLPAQRMVTDVGRESLNSKERMDAFKQMEKAGVFLSIDLAEGDRQVGEMEEIIAECPSLRIAIGHFGMTNRPNWEAQIKLARHKNVVVESGGITWLFHNEFYPYKGAVKAIQVASELVGEDKILWGSDYPRTMTAITYKMSYDFISHSVELGEVCKKKFLGENAVRFYRFGGLETKGLIKNMVED